MFEALGFWVLDFLAFNAKAACVVFWGVAGVEALKTLTVKRMKSQMAPFSKN